MRVWNFTFAFLVAAATLFVACDLMETPKAKSALSPLEAAARLQASADSATAYRDSLNAARKADSTLAATKRKAWITDSTNFVATAKALATAKTKDSSSALKTRATDSSTAAKHRKTDSTTYAKDSIAGAKTLAADLAKTAKLMAADTVAYNKVYAAAVTKLSKDSLVLLAAQTTKYAAKLAKDSLAVAAAQALVDAVTDTTSAKVKAARATKLSKAQAALAKDLATQAKAITAAQTKLTSDSTSVQASLAKLAVRLATTPVTGAAKYTKDSTAIAAKLARDALIQRTHSTADSLRLANDSIKAMTKFMADTLAIHVADSTKWAKKTADSLAILAADSTFNYRKAVVTFSPAAGNYSSAQSIALATTYTGSGAKIFYTTDGSNPNGSSSLYSSQIPLSIGQTIKAIAVQDGCDTTVVLGAKYTIGTTATPVFAPVAGSYTGTQNIVVTTTDSATIYYTTNGATPTTASASLSVYGESIEVDASETVKVLAIKSGKGPAAVTSAAYSILALAPTFLPEHDTTVVDSMYVHIISPDTTCVIHYTTDGSTPTISSRILNNSGDSIKINSIKTIKAIATKTGLSPSVVSTVNDTIQAGAPVLSLPEGDIDTATATETLTTSTKSAQIYYTTNSTIPNATSTLYTVPFRIRSEQVISAIAIKSGMKSSDVTVYDYTVPQ